MLRRLWDRIVTRVRPDRAELAPVISFESRSGRMIIAIRAQIRGQEIAVSNSALLSGAGRSGDRAFSLSQNQLSTVQSLLPRLRQEETETLTCKIFEIPPLAAEISALRELPHAKFSEAAEQLLHSALHPVEVKLKPIADFSETDKT